MFHVLELVALISCTEVRWRCEGRADSLTVGTGGRTGSVRCSEAWTACFWSGLSEDPAVRSGLCQTPDCPAEGGKMMEGWGWRDEEGNPKQNWWFVSSSMCPADRSLLVPPPLSTCPCPVKVSRTGGGSDSVESSSDCIFFYLMKIMKT